MRHFWGASEVYHGLGGCLLMFIGLLVSNQTVAGELVSLRAEFGLPRVTIALSAMERQALQTRGVIRLGVTADGYEPLEVVHDQVVEGIGADYLTIIGSALEVAVQVQVYADWPSALDALMAGRVDVLGRGSSYEQQLPGVLLSQPYTENNPVLVGRGVDMGEEALRSGGRMAAVDGYASAKELAARFPNMTMETFETVREALHSIEYQNNRWLVGDAVTVAYHLASAELPNLRMRPLGQWQPPGYGFVFREEDAWLRDQFNRVLAATPRLAQANILSRWGVNARFDTLQASSFTTQQLEWLATRPEIRVVVSGAIPPYSFFDDEGRFHGMLADLLAEVGLRSGMRFTWVRKDTINDVVDSLARGTADMTALLLPTPERRQVMSFTEPFAKSSFALVAPRQSAFRTMADVRGKKVAMVRGSSVLQYVHKQYPQVQPVLTAGYLEALLAVANGDAEAAILVLPVARYMINQFFAKELRLVTSLPGEQAALRFAVSKDNPMLYEVLQTVVSQLEPRLISSLVERWQSSLPAESSVWGGYERKMRRVYYAVTVVALILLSWLGYLYFNRLRLRAEKNRQAFRSALLDGIPQSVAVLDLQARFVLCNQTFFDVFRITPQAVIGRTWSEIEGLDQTHEAIWSAQNQVFLSFHDVTDVQQIKLHIQGDVVTFRRWAVPHRKADGQLLGVVMGWIDVSDTQSLLQQLHEARDQAVLASEAKSRFLAVMSHEIRTPLNAIIGLLELTLERVDRGEAWDRALIEVAFSSSQGLMLLIGDILDLAKIESGKLTLEPRRSNPRTILESLQRVFEGLARQKGLYLEVDLQLESDKDVLLDDGRLKQVLSNLLSNAIKFTEHGGIRLAVSGHEEGEVLCMELVVHDTGIGIAQTDQGSLFQPFSQVPGSPHQRSGTGLGLVICQQLIGMMGGQLRLDSELGFGTRVTVQVQVPLLSTLPVPSPPSPVEARVQARLKVLLVDDHKPNRLLLRQQLLFLGHEVREAEEGQQAFSLIKTEPFDVVITDCNMPVMDGYELTRQLRAAQHAGELSRCVIVGFTANAQAEEKVRCQQAGMDDCLFKPVGLGKLSACLAKMSQSAAGMKFEAPPEAANHQAPSSPLFDLPSLMALAGDDGQVVKMLLRELYDTNQVDIERFDFLMSARRWQEMRPIVHRLKGAARMVGAHELICVTQHFERALAQPGVDNDASINAMAVWDAVERLQADVRHWLSHS